jgi:hypothetical protein
MEIKRILAGLMTEDFFTPCIYNKTINAKYTEIVGFTIQLVPIICSGVTYFTYWDWRRVFLVSWEALDLGGGELVSWAAAVEALRMMKTDSCGYVPPFLLIYSKPQPAAQREERLISSVLDPDIVDP